MAAMLLTAWPQVSCESFSSSSGSFELEKLRREAGEPCDESRRAPLCSCVPYWNLWEEGDVKGQKQQERCPKAGPQSGLKGRKKTEGPMEQDASCVPEGLSGLRAQGSKLKSHGSSGPFPPEK